MFYQSFPDDDDDDDDADEKIFDPNLNQNVLRRRGVNHKTRFPIPLWILQIKKKLYPK